MAYISPETTKKIRKEINRIVKRKYKGFRVTVKNERHITLVVTIRQLPEPLLNYLREEYVAKLEREVPTIMEEIRNNYLQSVGAKIDGLKGKLKELVEDIDNIIRKVGKYYDRSDIMTDYFDVAFYYHINVGEWDKPAVVVKEQARKNFLKEV